MNKKIVLSLLIMSTLALGGCGTVSRHLGGNTEVNLPANTKLVNCQWDANDNLWYITKPMTKQDVQETYEFQEDSNLGVMNGTVTIKEHKE